MAEAANKHLFLQNHRDKCWPDGRPFSQMEAIQGLLANGVLTAPASAALHSLRLPCSQVSCSADCSAPSEMAAGFVHTVFPEK